MAYPVLSKARVAASGEPAIYRGSIETPHGASDFRELPETAEEIKIVARMFVASEEDVLLEDRASEEAFRLRPLAEYDVLHFATHGLIKQDLPGLTESALLLTPNSESDPLDDGLLSASELSHLTLGARLVVLSACNTAKYDLTEAGLSVQDFQIAFTIAGAPTVLAALWSIDSLTARDIVTAFFREWRSPASPFAADALAASTRSYLAGADAPHQHPRFWAAFQIAGYGHVQGAAPRRAAPSVPKELKPLAGYKSGGEIVAAGHLERDLVVSMIGDWNGKKMASIIARLGADGTQRWAVKSYEIGAGNLFVAGEVIYAVGYTSEMQSVPVIRSFSGDGRLRWKTKFDDLEGYTFSDLVRTPDAVLILAYPYTKAGDLNDAFLLELNEKALKNVV